MAESMAGRFSKLFDRIRGRENREDRKHEIDEDDIKEEKIKIPNSPKQPRRQVQYCEICFANDVLKLSLYLCYVCEVFVCDKCYKMHDQSHNLVKRKSKESMRGRLAEILVTDMRKERRREERMEREKVEIFTRINVKHELDKEDCLISGLCGLQDKRWVVLDNNNYCMKIYSSVTNTLLRYVRFGSEPRDATEIKQKFTDPNSASGSKSGVSGGARGELNKHCLLAVTFPYIKQIWFIDVNQTPATKNKTNEMQKECFYIDFNKDKIFTFCGEENIGFGPRPVSIVILSVEGNPYKVIQLDFRPGLLKSDLAVYKHKIYLTNYHNNKVLCINVADGKSISELSLEWSGPAGICVGPSNNVFVCGEYNDKVYKLSPDLHEFEPLNLDTEFTQKPFKICFTDGKLFVSHFDWESLRNTVTVVQLT